MAKRGITSQMSLSRPSKSELQSRLCLGFFQPCDRLFQPSHQCLLGRKFNMVTRPEETLLCWRLISKQRSLDFKLAFSLFIHFFPLAAHQVYTTSRKLKESRRIPALPLARDKSCCQGRFRLPCNLDKVACMLILKGGFCNLIPE